MPLPLPTHLSLSFILISPALRKRMNKLGNLGQEKDSNFDTSVEYMHSSHVLCGSVAVDAKEQGWPKFQELQGGTIAVEEGRVCREESLDLSVY